MKTTNSQKGFIYKLLGILGAKEEKENLAYAYSNGRTTHLSDLEQDEVRALIDFLKKEANLPETSKSKQVGKILSMAHEMRWELPGGAIDMNRVNSWCIKYGYLSKPLDDYHGYELPALVTQFGKAYKDFLKGL